MVDWPRPPDYYEADVCAYGGASGHCMDVSSLPVADCVQQAGLVTVNASDKGHGPPVGDRKYVYA